MIKTRNPILLRSVEDLADAKELRSVISFVLTSAPVDEDALQVAVWNFVGAERRAGVPPALVIKRLTGLMDDAVLAPTLDRQALTHRVILWCVEEYFGCLGGDMLGAPASFRAPGDEVVLSTADGRSRLRLLSRTGPEDRASTKILPMPAQPFAEYRDTPLWAAIEESINELMAIGDISINTSAEHAIGYLCQEIIAAKLITPRLI